MSGTDPQNGGREPIDRTQAYRPGAGGAQPQLPADLPKIPGITLNFEIARGGMGVVYCGRQDFLDRRVAVKFLSVELGGEKFAQRFQREAKILAGIKHPNIVACHSAGTTEDGQSYLVMEYVDGPNLKSWVGEHGPVAVPAALRLVRAVGQALAHANQLGVIHRDVKCENILLESVTSTAIDIAFPFVPKLVDLGLARMTYETAGLGLTSPGSVMGTPSTMSPEQFDEPDSVDFRTDIYGLGCVLYEMLVGVAAYRGNKLTDLVTKKREPIGPNPCVENPQVPAAVGELVCCMLAANRDARPRSYKELDERIEALQAQMPAAKPGATARPSGPRQPTAPRGLQFDNTGATIVGAGPAASRQGPPTPWPDAGPDAAAAPTASGAPRAKADAQPSGKGLLRTAEIDFLSAGLQPVASPPTSFPEPQAASTAPAQPGRRRSGLVAASAVLLVGGGVGVFLAMRGGDVPGKPEPAPVVAGPDQPVAPIPDVVPAPVKPRNLPPTGVAIRGQQAVALMRPFTLTADAKDPEGHALTFRWSAPEGSPVAFTRNDRNPAQVRLLDGLPGEAFEISVEVSDGENEPVVAASTVTVDKNDFPTRPFLLGFKAQARWSIDDRALWNEIADIEPYVACRTGGELRTIRRSLGDETYWHLVGQLESNRDDSAPGVYSETGVRLELGEVGWTFLCKRSGSKAETWSIELLQSRLVDGVWQAEPLTPTAKRIEWTEGDEERFGFLSIKRRGKDLTLQVGQLETGLLTHEVSLATFEGEPQLCLFVKGGRGAFHGFTMW